jgi:hypothetical protein
MSKIPNEGIEPGAEQAVDGEVGELPEDALDAVSGGKNTEFNYTFN